MSFRVKIFTFYITSIFSASRGIFSASRGDLVRISLNFSTFNILSLPRFQEKTAQIPPLNAYHYFEGFVHFFKPPSPILQTTKRPFNLPTSFVYLM